MGRVLFDLIYIFAKNNVPLLSDFGWTTLRSHLRIPDTVPFMKMVGAVYYDRFRDMQELPPAWADQEREVISPQIMQGHMEDFWQKYMRVLWHVCEDMKRDRKHH